MSLEILDTTLRDGAQGEGVEFSIEDKQRIAILLEQFGIPYIEAGNPFGNPKDKTFFDEYKKNPFLSKSQLVPFGATCRAYIEPEDDAGLSCLLSTEQNTISIFGKSDINHVMNVLRVSKEENLRMIEQSVRYLVSKGRTVLYDAEHFFDGMKSDSEYAIATLKSAILGGASTLVLCDTNGGTLPDEIYELTNRVVNLFSECKIGIHCHDDAGLAVACTLSAVKSGVTMIQGTIGGVGERCGNANLCTLLPTLQLKMGYTMVSSANLASLTDVSRMICDIMNILPNRRAPYIGYASFAHKGGMHIDGVSKTASSFEHISPELVGNRRRFLISDQVGRTGVYHRVKRLFPEIERDDPKITALIERLKRREQRGYAYESADASFSLLALATFGHAYRYFEISDFHVISGGKPNKELAQAYIKITVDGKNEINAAEGDGPVNAMDIALRKVLMVFYPSLTHMQLRDFKVRVVKRGGTASVVRVIIESTDGHQVWTTVGVSANIIEACLRALCDSVSYYLSFVNIPEGNCPKLN